MSTIHSVGIRGAGLSGLSVARELLQRKPDLAISIFDVRPRLPHPQRTFCYFHRDSTFKAPCKTAHWNSITFRGALFERRIEVPTSPYTMIRGDDFFDSILGELESAGVSLHWSCTDVVVNGDSITAGGEIYTFDCVIDAAFTPTTAATLLWQSFAGVWVSSPTAIFDPSSALLMDIGESTQRAPVSFLYVLPISATTALVEHTTFSPAPLPQEHHLQHCTAWLARHAAQETRVLEYESGAIPMGLQITYSEGGLRTGSNAGTVRPATGYAFLATQRHARALSEQILHGGSAPTRIYPRWLECGDRLFLRALLNSPTTGGEILERLLARAPSEALIAFLNGDASLRQALSVWFSAPRSTMLKALLRPGIVTALFLCMAAGSYTVPQYSEWCALALMIVAGIPHGSFDLRVARLKWRAAASSRAWTILCYLVCVCTMSALCVFTPLLGLSLFLAISALHFCEGEAQSDREGDRLRGAIFGSGAIVAPIGLHLNQAGAYMSYFVSGGLISEARPLLTGAALLMVAIMVAILSYDILSKRNQRTTFERLICLVGWVVLPPLAGFAVWFIGRHSRQHLELCHRMFRHTAKGLPFDFLAISLLAIAGLAPFMLLFDFSDINQLFAAAICLIAGLTLPHMIVSHGMQRLPPPPHP